MATETEGGPCLNGGYLSELRYGVGLRSIVDRADKLLQVKKSDMHAGDWVFVKTENSLYRIRVLGDGFYEASGGWFDKKGGSPMKVRIAGCSWGGSIIKTGLVAAPGLFLEFGNRLVTTPIQIVIVMRSATLN